MKRLVQITLILSLFLAIYGVESPPVPATPKPNYTSKVAGVSTIAQSATTTAILALTNEDRVANGEPSLVQNSLLMYAAEYRANFLCGKPFSHYADGSTPWDAFRLVGYPYSYAGENLAEGYLDASHAEMAFMNSPEHRDNILNPNYTEYGVAWACGRTVVLFGSR